MKKISLFLLVTIFSICVSAQNSEIQYDYDFKVHNDYEKFDYTVVDIADWMMATPINQDPDQRRKYQTFLMNWAAGHPKVKIVLNEWTNVTDIGDKNPVLMIIFIAAWSKKSIESKQYNKLTDLHLASIMAVSRFYELNKDHLRKDRCVEKYIRLEKKEKLQEWVRKRIE